MTLYNTTLGWSESLYTTPLTGLGGVTVQNESLFTTPFTRLGGVTEQNESHNITRRTGRSGASDMGKLYYLVSMVMTWILTACIISLNTTVIIQIVRYKKRSRLYTFLLHLAIADLVTGVIDCLPNAIERTLGFEYAIMTWLAGDVVCKIQRTLSQCSSATSNYILACMSVDRALVVYKPMHSVRRGTMAQKGAIATCWIFTLSLSLILTPFFKVFQTPLPVPHCSIQLSENPVLAAFYYEIMLVTMFVVMVAIPFIIIVISYIILVVCIYRRGITPRNSVNTADTIMTTRVFNNAVPRTKIKSIKLTIGIVLCFIASWIPCFTFLFLNFYDGFNQPILMPMIVFYYLNSLVNPILFFIYHRRRSRGVRNSLYSSDTVPGRPNASVHTLYTSVRNPSCGSGGIQNNCHVVSKVPFVNRGINGDNNDCCRVAEDKT